jgi:hypothetical protein
MFPVKARAVLPVEHISITSVSVRGSLGHMTVWVSNEDITASNVDDNNYTFRLSQRHWTKVYQKFHPPSRREYVQFVLTEPVFVHPNQVRMLYVHSTHPSDTAVVYDNTSMPNLGRTRGSPRPPPRYQDDCISIHTGKAHLSPTPFGQYVAFFGFYLLSPGSCSILYSPRLLLIFPRRGGVVLNFHISTFSYVSTMLSLILFFSAIHRVRRSPIWGWGNAFRDHREFVGRLEYGTVYQLWSPERHGLFGDRFHTATELMLLLQRKPDCLVSRLPDECVYYILNLCRWDWFVDDSGTMQGNHRKRKAVLAEQRRNQLQAEGEERARQLLLQQRQRARGRVAAATVAAGVGDDESIGEGVAEPGANRLAINMLLGPLAALEQLPGPAEPPNDSGSESDETDESAWERANGYRADNSAFQFLDYSSNGEEGSEDDNDTNNNAADGEQFGGRGWFRSHIARIHVLRALGGRRSRAEAANLNIDTGSEEEDDSDDDYDDDVDDHDEDSVEEEEGADE